MRNIISKVSTCTFLVLGISSCSFLASQVQQGLDIDGVSGDHSGWSVDLDSSGTTLAIGAIGHDGNGTSSGTAKVYEWNGSAWVQKGSDLTGEHASDGFGESVALSHDGNVVASSSIYNDDGGTNAGHVRIYDWNGSTWVQKGGDIDGEAAEDRSGLDIALNNNGSTIIIGSPENDDNGSKAGQIRVYEWNGSAWVQKGNDIHGEAADDRFGTSVDINNAGNIIAVGAIYNDGSGADAGHTRIYEWDGTNWVQKGADIDGDVAGDQLGKSVSLNGSGNILAVGSPANDDSGADAGSTKIFEWNGTAWIQKGTDIDGEAAGDKSGNAISINNSGNMIAIGAWANGGSAVQAGHVRAYEWNGSAWVQKGVDIDGEMASGYSGMTVDVNYHGNSIAVGAPNNSGVGFINGHARVYTFCDSYHTLTETVCNFYNVPSGDETHLFSGTYTDTIPNHAGCDSILTINLTVNNSHIKTVFDTVCGSYRVPSGDETYSVSGTYTDTIPTHLGCDSILLINLIVNNSSSNAFSETGCGSYTVPSGDETYTVSGTYMDTIPNHVGCDSILTINLTITGSSSNAFSETGCGSYTVPSGDETYTVSGTYMDTIPNHAGCDSVLTINLTVNHATLGELMDTACGEYTVPSGDEIYSTSGTYLDTIPNMNGCDSILTIHVVIHENPDTTVDHHGDSLSAVMTGISYQWLDCNKGGQVLINDTLIGYKPQSSGLYSLELNNNGCIDTSSCHEILINSLTEHSISKFNLYPNPVRGRFVILTASLKKDVNIELYDPTGRVLKSERSFFSGTTMVEIPERPGVYLLKVDSKEMDTTVFKIIR